MLPKDKNFLQENEGGNRIVYEAALLAKEWGA